jgi:hypothetical protein
MRDWVCGHYYNPLFQGIRAYGHWKWNYLKGDVNYDAKVDMGDVTTTLKGFGSFIHQGGSLTIHPRWNFYCDVYDSPRYRWRDRKIDLGDIVNTLPNFGKTTTPWQPPP